MTPRQRVLAALRREEPDRVPRELSFGAFTPALMQVFRERTGYVDPAEYWNFEVRPVNFRHPDPLPSHKARFPSLPEGAFLDAWGMVSVPGSSWHFVRYLHPLGAASTPQEIVDYPLPDLRAERSWQEISEQVRGFHAAIWP